MSFLQFLADVSEKPTAVIAIYVYASESSCFALLENGSGYLYYDAITWSLMRSFRWR